MALHHLLKSTTSLKTLELTSYSLNGGDCYYLVLGMLRHFSDESASLVKLSILHCNLDADATLNFVEFMQGFIPVIDTDTATRLSLRELRIDRSGMDASHLEGFLSNHDTGPINASMLSRQSQTSSDMKQPTNGSQLQEISIHVSSLVFLRAVESDSSIGQLPKLNVTDAGFGFYASDMDFWEDCLSWNELSLNFSKNVCRTRLQAILSYLGTHAMVHSISISCINDPDRISADMSKRLQASCSRNRLLPKLLGTMPWWTSWSSSKQSDQRCQKKTRISSCIQFFPTVVQAVKQLPSMNPTSIFDSLIASTLSIGPCEESARRE